MQTRRDFLNLMPLTGATMLAACGGGASDDSDAVGVDNKATATGVSKVGRTQKVEAPAAPTALAVADQVPAYVVVEDWGTGAAVDAGRIEFTTLIRQDAFADANLAADCKGWTEHGPATVANLPVLNGVQFSAKRFTIQAGGQYSKTSYRVIVMMRALGLQDGLFGDVRGVKTYAGPHKLRIMDAAGNKLKVIEMRDGLPINDTSLVNVPFEWTVTNRPSGLAYPDVASGYENRLSDDKAMRPHMSAGSAYVAFFGDEPESSPATRSHIPRVKSDLWPSKNSKVRAIYNGLDVHLWGGNGFCHVEALPQWAMSINAANAVGNVAPNDPEVYNPTGAIWSAALTAGWGYEPGALGGITRRGGPGGVRIDRTTLPSEIYQMALSQTVRKGDNTSTASMARGHALNHANYPGYYPRSMTTLDAINTFSAEPQPTYPGRDVYPAFHYYGGNLFGPAAVWIIDAYGSSQGPICQAIEFCNPGAGTIRSKGSHVRNGWMPDSEHANRAGAAWAALLYSDPLFSRMAEHMMMLEGSMMSPVVSRTDFGGATSQTWDKPGNFWMSRTNLLPFCTTAMMWWTATQNGVYTRPVIEERLHSFFAKWKDEVRDFIPAYANASSASSKSFDFLGLGLVQWATWGAENNYEAGSGWTVGFGIQALYLGNLFIILKASGLYGVLKARPKTAATLEDLERYLELNARMFVTCPWATAYGTPSNANTEASPPYLLLRSAAQGAVQNDFSTIPTTHAQVARYNPAPRQDDHWFLSRAATPGVDSPAYNGGTYATFGRMQTARAWWDLLAPTGPERTAALSAVDSRISKLSAYTPTVYDAAFTRFNFAQSIPAMSA